ncbi:glycerol kinase GlpK [Demequina mangrovi]|uniref:Glycerol kinase n=1 Tax=Demequina mangrovi TaxID=1043493 RepID=A0A1H6ZBY7_9MICO|nr:glycerol kinase GlpK [Demequina mangrovi]SEJ50931.1 glycerol kinase [Demequina mangrovi]
MTRYVLAIDQGTTSTRAIVFDRDASIVAQAQREHRQLLPRAGWVEHDPVEIWAHTRLVVAEAFAQANITRLDVAALGIANQRETTIVWDRRTGEPVHPAIVWQDTRTQPEIDVLADEGGVDRFRHITGLPLATYFSASKLAWILDNVAGARDDAEAGHLAFGTPDTWLAWNLTGGVEGGIHVTDVTNASRTLLMDIQALEWSDEVLEAFRIPRAMLPEIRSSSEVYGVGHTNSLLRDVPLAGILGDQQAAMFGQAAFDPGESKGTYGSGAFLLVNTGDLVIHSDNGLLTTVAYRLGDAPAQYALEGSIAVTGALVQWLRDNLGIIDESGDIETLASSVPDNGGVYIVPAFSGLFAPLWRPDARGTVVGLTQFVTKAHLARAALEATVFQTRDVVAAGEADAGLPLQALNVDGGMAVDNLLMQFMADVLGLDVVRPEVTEATALGAAHAAGLATGYWRDLDELRDHWHEDRRWGPLMPRREAERLYRNWRKAVARSLDWVDEDVDE